MGVASGLLTTSLATQLRTNKEYRENNTLVAEEFRNRPNRRSQAAKTKLLNVKQGRKSYIGFSIMNSILTFFLLLSLAALIILSGTKEQLGFGIVQLATILFTSVQALAVSFETFLLDKHQAQLKTILADDNVMLLDDAFQVNQELRQENEQLATENQTIIAELAAAKALLNLSDNEVQKILSSCLAEFSQWHKRGLTINSLQQLTVYSLELQNIRSTKLSALVESALITPDEALNLSVLQRNCLEKNVIYEQLLELPKEQAILSIEALINLPDKNITLSNLDKQAILSAINNDLISIETAVQLQDYHNEILGDEYNTFYKLLKNLETRPLFKDQFHKLTLKQIEDINDLDLQASNIQETIEKIIEGDYSVDIYTKLFKPVPQEQSRIEEPSSIKNIKNK